MEKVTGKPLDKIEREKKKAEKKKKADQALDAAVATPPEETEPSSHDGGWRGLLLINKETGKLSKTMTNAMVLFEHHADLNSPFAMNTLGQRLMLMKQVPWDRRSDFPRRINDADIVKATAWLERKGLMLGRDTIAAVLATVAYDHEYDPIQDYLEKLTWDGTSRLEHLLVDLYGCVDTVAMRTIARKFMIGAVARAMRPGEKVDNILVLEGMQGLRKSTSIKVLFGAEWSLETMEQIGTKDARQQISGYWVVELPELDHLTRSQTEAVKAWLSTQIDDFRPPWGRFNIQAKRRCVFMATHNPGAAWLDDPTGARRFWIVECTKVDIDGIAAQRDQLWAEAVHAYRAGEPWWFNEFDSTGDDPALQQIRESQRNRFQNDAWYNLVVEHIDGLLAETITLDQILQHLNIPKDRWDKMAQTRVGKIVAATQRWRKRDRGPNAKPRYVYERIIDPSKTVAAPVPQAPEPPIEPDPFEMDRD